MKKLSILLAALLLLTGCGTSEIRREPAPTNPETTATIETTEATEATDATESREAYMNITQEEAKELMDTQENYIILDVRRQDEYDEKHIPGAILIPNEVIRERAEAELTDKDQLILVYCRSGRRSKIAAEILVDLGYTNIKEFGGILDWPYEVE